jgi:rhamnulokinase
MTSAQRDDRQTVRVCAVDLGASSGRVLVGEGGAKGFAVSEVHRFPTTAVMVDGVLRWDILALYQGVLEGLRRAAAGGPIDSVGIDGWGVDYGLLDADGQLLANPVHYRDRRNETAMRRLLQGRTADAMYASTGIQMIPLNTIFSLATARDTAAFAAARSVLLIPDLIAYWLTGIKATELTNASTTALLDVRTSQWASGLARDLGIPIGLFPPLVAPGAVIGTIRPDIAADVGLRTSTSVVAVPSHDTAAAVAGIPAEDPDFAYVCTGTWALVGLETPAPVINARSQAANFSNEIGADGTICFLRNVTGFWLMQECAREWTAAGLRVDIAELSAQAAALPPLRARIDVMDPSFTASGAMHERISAAAARTSGVTLTSPAEITRCILDSMALAIRAAISEAGDLASRAVRVVHLVGGGAANPPFCQIVADACGLPVVAGPIEAASWGNVMSQARALGAVPDDLAAARSVIRASVRLDHYRPRSEHAATWELAAPSSELAVRGQLVHQDPRRELRMPPER